MFSLPAKGRNALNKKRQLKLCGQDSYSEESPQSIRLWFPSPRGSPPRVCREDLFLSLLLQFVFFLGSARAAKSSNLQAHNLNLKIVRFGDIPFQALEGGTDILLNFPTFEAGQVQMVLLRLNLVIVLLTIEVHKIQLVDQAQALQQIDSPINRSPVNVRVAPAGQFEEACSVEMLLSTLNRLDQSPPL